MISAPPHRLRPARRRPLRWLPAVAVLASAAAVIVMIAWSVASHVAPRLAVRAFDRAMSDDPRWSGEIRDLQLDLWRATGVVRGLSVRAASDQKVLRSVDIPVGHLRWSWRSVLAGRLHVDLVAISPTVGARARPERVAPPDPPIPDPGWFRFEIDAAIVDGTWIWRDPGRDPEVHLALHPVNGEYEHIGTVDGPGRLVLVASAPDSGLVAVDARLDFWAAHRDAIDIAMRLQGLRPAAFQGADLSYAGIRLSGGRFDGHVAVTWDAGRQELDGPPYAVGNLDDLRSGRIRARLEGRELVVADPPVARIALRDLRLVAEGPVVGDEPYQVSALGDGLELHVRRSDLATLADLPNTGRATLDQTLRRLPAFRLPLVRVTGAEVRFTDDAAGATFDAADLRVEVRGFDNVSAADLPPTFEAHGTLVGGTLDVRGTLEPLVWPPSFTVDADLRGVSVVRPEIARALRGYTGVVVEQGIVGAEVTARSDGGEIVADAALSGRDLVAVSSGWRVGVGAIDLALAEGIGRAADVHVAPERVSALTRLQAPRVDVRWDMARLADLGELVAEVHAHQPLVVARRPPPGGRLPRRGSARWSVDLHAHGGRLVWEDPTTTPAVGLILEPFDARVLRLGTLEARARWEVAGTLTRGGALSGWSEIDAFGGPGSRGPMRMEVRGTDLPLGALRDVTEAYLGLQLADGAADVRLALDEHGGQLDVDATGLDLADPPVDAIRAERVRTRLEWDEQLGPAARTLTGAAHGVTVRVSEPPSGARAGAVRDVLDALPVLSVPWFDVTGSDVVVVAPVGGVERDVVFDGVDVAVRSLRTGAGRDGSGVVHASAGVGGGRVRLEARAPEHEPATVWVCADGLSMPELDPWVHAATGLDTAGGRVDAAGRLSVADSGGIAGQLDVFLTDTEIRSDVLRDGLGVWLRSAAAGAVVDVIERDGTARIVLPVEGTAEAPVVRPGKAVLRAVLVRLGLARPHPAVRAPVPVPAPMGPAPPRAVADGG